MTELKEPLPSQIQTGYMLSKADRKGTKYLWDSIECLDQAIKDTNADITNRTIYYSEVATAKRKIFEAMAGLQKAKEAHEILRQINLGLGYREITNKDFEKFGAGGHRKPD